MMQVVLMINNQYCCLATEGSSMTWCYRLNFLYLVLVKWKFGRKLKVFSFFFSSLLWLLIWESKQRKNYPQCSKGLWVFEEIGSYRKRLVRFDDRQVIHFVIVWITFFVWLIQIQFEILTFFFIYLLRKEQREKEKKKPCFLENIH